MSNNHQAFEYVLGTLRGKQRQQFEQDCVRDAKLRFEVNYWEEHLMALEDSQSELKPFDHTWDGIAARLPRALASPTLNTAPRLWLHWLASAACTAIILVAITLLVRVPTAPNTQYIAVLTDDTGKAILTALTLDADKILRLQWDPATPFQGQSQQLWAISRRDGHARSIAVFEHPGHATLALNQAHWRLITDAEYLLLTAEELGGSAVDEPSQDILAKGVCVRYKPEEKS